MNDVEQGQNAEAKAKLRRYFWIRTQKHGDNANNI